MIYTIPTKRGLGVELWGTRDDLTNLHQTIAKFWNHEEYFTKPEFENRDTLISGFSYEIRKAYEDSRLKRQQSHFSFEAIEHLGTQFSWVHILFAISALRHNMRVHETSKYDIAVFLQLEYWLERSMKDFDEVGAKTLAHFIEGGIYSGNTFLYQYMRSINADYFMLGGGKKAFRKLPELLNCAIFQSKEYKEYLTFLTEEAKRLKCEINDLELSDDDLDYGSIIW